MNDPILLAAALARRFEGLCLRPYVCAAGYWTIGYGSRWLANGAAMCAHAAPITAAEAESLLLAALRTLQPEIRKIVHVSLTARQEPAHYGLKHGYCRLVPENYRHPHTGEERVREEFRLTRRGVVRLAEIIAKLRKENGLAPFARTPVQTA
ncbi:glycoside hydrolase family protein [Acetobacter tropicalis]|nr:hypothetical protein [Acetobacter tropicalis]